MSVECSVSGSGGGYETWRAAYIYQLRNRLSEQTRTKSQIFMSICLL